MKKFDSNKSMQYIEKNVVDLAKERMKRACELYDTIAVGFSGGKDSTATLNIAIEVAEEMGKLPVQVIFFDEEAIPVQTEEYVRRVSKDPRINLHWLCFPIKARNACSRRQPFWHPWNPDAKEKWVREFPPEGVMETENLPIEFIKQNDHYDLTGAILTPDKFGTVGYCLGIRAQESLSRLRSVTAKQYENYIVQSLHKTDQGNVFKVYPIYDWRHQDVWTAPRAFGWDYNRAYDRMDKAGIKISLQRCSPAYGNEPLQKLWVYKTAFPEIWDKMSVRVEGANTASKYALTSLYAHGKRPQKPDNMKWEEFLAHYIKKYPKENRDILAKRIKYEIKAHYAKTKDPILEKSPHPKTGLSWNFLLMLAMRTDEKGRKIAGAKILTHKMDKYWESYRAELKEFRKAKQNEKTK